MSLNVNVTVEMVVGVVAKAETGRIVTETMTGAAGGGAVADLPVTARTGTGEEAAMTGLTAKATAGEACSLSDLSHSRNPNQPPLDARKAPRNKGQIHYTCVNGKIGSKIIVITNNLQSQTDRQMMPPPLHPPVRHRLFTLYNHNIMLTGMEQTEGKIHVFKHHYNNPLSH